MPSPGSRAISDLASRPHNTPRMCAGRRRRRRRPPPAATVSNPPTQHREAPEDRLFRRIEQPMAPVDRGGQPPGDDRDLSGFRRREATTATAGRPARRGCRPGGVCRRGAPRVRSPSVRPSNRRHISRTVAALPAGRVKPGARLAARSTNKLDGVRRAEGDRVVTRRCSVRSDSSPTRNTVSPGTRSASRLVARIRNPGAVAQQRSRPAERTAAPDARSCPGRQAGEASPIATDRAASVPARPARSPTPSAAATACASGASSCSESSSISRALSPRRAPAYGASGTRPGAGRLPWRRHRGRPIPAVSSGSRSGSWSSSLGWMALGSVMSPPSSVEGGSLIG